MINGLAEVERDHIVRALEASNWVIGGRNGAAERLGMKRTSLLYRMQRLGIESRAAHTARRFPSAWQNSCLSVFSSMPSCGDRVRCRDGEFDQPPSESDFRHTVRQSQSTLRKDRNG